MRHWLFALVLSVAAISSAGCFLPIYSSNPATRTRELIFTSENLRVLLEEWQRFWFLDQPSHMSPNRVHGGII